MKIRTAAQYRARQRRLARAHRPRRRLSDWDPETRAWLLNDVSMTEALAQREKRQPLAVRKPNHAARAVDIQTCFPPLGLSLTGPRTRRPGAKPSTHATPLDWHQRADRYLAQSGRITPAQSRRLWSKDRRAQKHT